MAYKLNDRCQMNLFPATINDYVSANDPVRVYDAFVGKLNFDELGIPLELIKAGAREYYPKDMLKLIIYGTSYGIRTSRKLERACYHNVSFMWLMSNLKPDYRTIARFRQRHREAIKKVLKQCVKVCIELGLIEGNTLFTDGSFFRANASIKNTWTEERCKKQLKKVFKRIDRLVDESIDTDNAQEEQKSLVKIDKELTNKTELEKKMQKIISKLKEEQKNSINTTDPECVKVKSRQGTHAGYNAQITVDEKHGLIVNSESTDHNQDANQLSRQVKEASRVLNKKPRTVVADSGYHSLEDLDQVDKGIDVIVPSQKQAQEENSHPLSPFDKDKFIYNPQKDEYICPEGKSLKYQTSARTRLKPRHWMEHFKKNSPSRYKVYRADSEDCRTCRHFKTCTTSPSGRQISRFKQEDLKHKLEAAYKSPEGQKIYKLRKEKVELPFGHMKRNLQAGQFLLRGKAGTNAELAILSTCFNIARMITLIGVSTLILRFKGT